VLLPGGALNADALRVEKEAQEFVREIDRAKKPIAVICHGPWLLVSAGLVKGRTLTSYHTIQDDIRNAGGNWKDQEVVRDANWVSSRQPSDIPAFNREMLALFAETKARAKTA
jgi:protease I